MLYSLPFATNNNACVYIRAPTNTINTGTLYLKLIPNTSP